MAQDAPRPTETQPSTNPSLAQLIAALHIKAHSLEAASGMRSSFQTFIAAHHLALDSIRYSDYVMALLFFEATREVGFWNPPLRSPYPPPDAGRISPQYLTPRAPC